MQKRSIRHLSAARGGAGEKSEGLGVARVVPRLPEVLSIEKAARLLRSATGMKYKAALGVIECRDHTSSSH